jgi:chromosomal replication initiator protein
MHARIPTVAYVMGVVARRYDVSIIELLSDRRRASIVEPRHVAMFLARRCTLQSLPQIGRAMRRDHTSVWHAEQRVRQRMAAEPDFAALVEQLAAEITTGSSQSGQAHKEVA